VDQNAAAPVADIALASELGPPGVPAPVVLEIEHETEYLTPDADQADALGHLPRCLRLLLGLPLDRRELPARADNAGWRDSIGGSR